VRAFSIDDAASDSVGFTWTVALAVGCIGFDQTVLEAATVNKSLEDFRFERMETKTFGDAALQLNRGNV
jgi:hypothetical protein